MATMSLSILGLYNWCAEMDQDSIFSEFVVPESVDTEVLENNILMQAAPFEICYADPDVLRELIGAWSASRLPVWNKIEDLWSKSEEFNPLENFDRTETETIEHSGTDTQGNTQTRNLAGADNRTQNLADNETRNLSDSETRNLTDEHKVSAYDSSNYSAKDLDTHTGSDTFAHTGTVGTTHTGTDNRSMTDTGTIADQGAFVHGHKIGRQARYHGNVGVTSLARLFQETAELSEKWDLYAIITQEFIQEFCVMVY